MYWIEEKTSEVYLEMKLIDFFPFYLITLSHFDWVCWLTDSHFVQIKKANPFKAMFTIEMAKANAMNQLDFFFSILGRNHKDFKNQHKNMMKFPPKIKSLLLHVTIINFRKDTIIKFIDLNWYKHICQSFYNRKLHFDSHFALSILYFQFWNNKTNFTKNKNVK